MIVRSVFERENFTRISYETTRIFSNTGMGEDAGNGNCNGIAPFGGPYIIENNVTAIENNVTYTETSFTEYVCTENSCAAVVMPEGATAAADIGGGIVSCQANLTLNTFTEPTRCVIACDETNGYIYQLGTLNCLPTSENGAALITNTNSSTFTCEPVRCSTTIAFTGIESDFSDSSACNSSADGLRRGENCSLVCGAGYEPSAEFRSVQFQAQCPSDASNNARLDLPQTPCEECDRGYYSDSASSNACSPCPKNTFASVSGRTQCEQCDSGM